MKKLFILFILFSAFSCQKLEIDKKSHNNPNPFYDKAYDFTLLGKGDSAYVYYDKAQEIFKQNKDSLGIGKCIVQKGIILTDRGDYYGGQELSLSAKKYFNENNRDHYSYICSNYNNLGIASNFIKDYTNAIKFYDLAIKFADTDIHKFIYYKNKANTYKEEKKYPQAIRLYQDILPYLKNTDKKIYARLVSNLEGVKSLNDALYNPESQILQAIEIEKKINDQWGQNASYAHLVNYYATRNNEKALFYAEKMYTVAQEIKSPADRLEALRKLTALDSKNRVNNFKKYTELADSIQTEKDNSDNKFAFIRFEVEQNKTENQKLKTISAQNETLNIKKNAVLASLSIALIAGFFIYKRRKKILKQEKELEVKNTQLKMSKKVHDVVANGVYQIITEIENQEGLDKNRILYKLENVYEKSRDLSYENVKPNKDENFSEKISNLLVSFQNENRRIFIVRNDDAIWNGLTRPTKEEVFHVIQELMINMKKHSQADQVVVRFERQENNIHIYYSDDGIGIAEEINPKNGMQNTVIRIQAIQGKIIFDRQTEKGLKVNISFPIS